MLKKTYVHQVAGCIAASALLTGMLLIPIQAETETSPPNGKEETSVKLPLNQPIPLNKVIQTRENVPAPNTTFQFVIADN